MKYIFGKDNRNYWMGLSILWIILLHISQNTDNQYLNTLFGNGYLGVDVFFMLSSYGLGYSYNKNRLVSFYSNRFKRIFPEYIIYLIILFGLFGNEFNENLYLLGFYQCTGIANFRNVNVEWYIPALIILYVIYPLLYECISYLWKMNRSICIILIPFLAVFVSHYGWTSMLWLSAPRTVIIYTTILLFLAKDDTKSTLIICLVPALTSFCLRANDLGFSPALYLPLLCYAISCLKPSLPFKEAISYLGGVSLEIYLAQSIVVQYFIRENAFGLNLFVLYGISMIMMVVLTYMFHYTNFIWQLSFFTRKTS